MYVKNSDVREVFLSVLPLDSVTRDGYLDAPEKELKKQTLRLTVFQPFDWYHY
jgi:hypothetical protein